MKNEAKEILKNSTEVKTVKSLREKYGFSLIDAKKIVDSVKEHLSSRIGCSYQRSIVPETGQIVEWWRNAS